MLLLEHGKDTSQRQDAMTACLHEGPVLKCATETLCGP